MEPREREVNLRDYADIMVKRKAVIGLSVAIVTLSSLLFSMRNPVFYKAVAYIAVEKVILARQYVESDKDVVDKYMAGFIKSYALAEEVMHSIMTENAGNLKKEGELAGGSVFEITPNELQKSIVVEQGGGSEVVGIGVLTSNPKKSEYLANMTAKVFVDLTLKGLGGGVQSELNYVEKQIEVFKKKIEKNKQDLAKYGPKAETEAVVSPENQSRLDRIQKEYAETRLSRQMAETRLKVLQEKMSSKGGKNIFPISDQSQQLFAMKDKLSELEAKRSGLLVQFTEEHPSVIGAQLEIDKIKRTINEELKKPIEDLKMEIEGLKTKEDTFKEVIETNFGTSPQMVEKPENGENPDDAEENGGTEKSESSKKEGGDYTMSKLKFELAINEKIYTILVGKLEPLRVQALLEANKVRILRFAAEPKQPEKPKGPPPFLVAMSLGLILGVTGAFIQENMDTSLTTIEDVEYYVNQPVIGVIPLIRPENIRKHGKGRH